MLLEEHPLKPRKIEEGLYEISSKECPTCKAVAREIISGGELYMYNQGLRTVVQLLTEKGVDVDVREQFISGVCSPCWNEMFPEEED